MNTITCVRMKLWGCERREVFGAKAIAGANASVWEYEPGSEVLKIADGGHIRIDGLRWEISRALAGEWVQLIRVESKILVYYCRSLVRELDPPNRQSTAVDWRLIE